MNFQPVRCIILLILGLSRITFSITAQSNNQPARLFESDELLELKLVAEIDSLIQDIGEAPKKHRAMLYYFDKNGDEIPVPVKVYTRGNFRRRPENCNFPPLEFEFSKKNIENTVFEGQDELKLVTHCQTDSSEFEQFLFKEYLVYRVYNEFSPFSFRVRLFRITYIEKDNPGDSFSSYGFFLERPKHMAARNGGTVLKIENFSPSDVDVEIFARMALFQYMIANNDWYISVLHNVKLVSYDPLIPPVPVPYDFDYAGIVEAPYRSLMRDPSEDNTSDRFYKGLCWKRRKFISLFDIFKQKKSVIFQLYQDFEFLDEDQKARILMILVEFYDLINRPGAAIQEFKKDCNLQ